MSRQHSREMTPVSRNVRSPRIAAKNDSSAFRQVMGLFATGVAVITSESPAGPTGLTVNSMCSLSLTPLLVMVGIDISSRTLPAIQESGKFGVSILTADQHEWSRRLASKLPESDKLTGVPYIRHRGVPLLADVLAWLVCKVVAIYPGGDHVIVVGEVQAMGRGDEDSSPLIFFEGAYTALNLRRS
jgi:flavin reductase (DIM6/NTAB) family NADH-FMN oxidoreductase RutF